MTARTPEPTFTAVGRSPAGRAASTTVARCVRFLRSRYYPINRLLVRVVEAVTAVALGGVHQRWLLAAAAGCVLVDLATTALLRRRPRLLLSPRLLLDAADVAAWSLALARAPDLPVQVAAPLAIEAGARLGLRGLVVPAVIGGVTSAALLLANRPLQSGPFLWPLVGVVLGDLLIRYLAVRLEQGVRAAREEIEAAAGQAELAGQNSIALGADTVVDLLARTAPLLAVGEAHAVPSPLSTWKRELAEACSRQSTYLGVALARWERVRNARSPNLRLDVELRCAAAAGAVLLSPAQARWLSAALGASKLRGRVPVDAIRTGLPGQEHAIRVGARTLVIPADPSRPPVAMDPGPVAFALAGIGSLSHSLPTFEAVPAPVTVPCAMVAAWLAWWSHRYLQRVGRSGHARVLAAALALGVYDALASTLFMRNPVSEGLARAPFMLFAVWGAPLYLLYERDLIRAQRWAILGIAAGTVTIGFALLPAPVPLAHATTFPVWLLAAVLGTLGLRDLLDQDAAETSARLDGERRRAVERAYQRGRCLVVEIAGSAAAECRRTYRRVRARLDPEVAVEAGRRLAEAEAQLRMLSAGLDR